MLRTYSEVAWEDAGGVSPHGTSTGTLGEAPDRPALQNWQAPEPMKGRLFTGLLGPQ